MGEQTCPVCEGRGVMPGAFYGAQQDVVACRSCGGRTTVSSQVAEAATGPSEYAPSDLTGS